MYRVKSTLIALGLVGFVPLCSSVANAQTLSPMRQVVSSFTDRVIIRVTPKNPYQHRIRMEVRVYDKDYNPIKARVQPRVMMLGAGAGRQVAVTVPFEGKKQKKIRICAESVPFQHQANQASIKARVCGRFFLQQKN